MYAVTVGVDTGTSLLHRVEEDVVVSREFASEKLDDFFRILVSHLKKSLHVYKRIMYIMILHVLIVCLPLFSFHVCFISMCKTK